MGNGREFTLLSVILGVIIGVLFGAANAFLGLKVGMTVSASIPAAVISMGVLRSIFRRNSILENNIVQTIGSAGTSVASGIVFTVPALFIMGLSPDYWTIAAWAAIGGTLGVLFMIPLRHYLIVKEHENLKYPEGLACAEVLEAGQKGGGLAKTVFWGLGISFVYSFLRDLGFWRPVASVAIPQLRTKATLDASPALLGVGYIIGPRISAYMLAGAVLGWYVLIPSLSFFGAEPFGPILEDSAISVPVIEKSESCNQFYVIPEGRNTTNVTALLCIKATKPLDSTSNGMRITMPEEFDLTNAQVAGVTAGDFVYKPRQRLDGQTLTLDLFRPSLDKTASAIQPGRISIVIHGIDNPSNVSTQPTVTTFKSPEENIETFELSDAIYVPDGETLVQSCTEPGERQITAIITYEVSQDIINNRERIAFDLANRFEYGYTDPKSYESHDVSVVSVFDGTTVFSADASVFENSHKDLPAKLDRPLLMTSKYTPRPKPDAVLRGGIVAVVLHGLVNAKTPPADDHFDAFTISSPGTIFPASKAIAEMGPDEIHKNFIKYIGAGAVAIGGLLSLFKSFPTIIGSLWHLFLAMFAPSGSKERTTRDLPFILVAGGVVAIAAIMWKLPELKAGWQGTVLVCVFGFFFVTVSSRLVGLIGSSSNPTSGMTIATLLGTSLLFFYFVPDLADVKFTALSVGAMVCVAISVSGDVSQDLKTGYLVQGTPWKQQIGEIIGVLTAAVCVAGVIFVLHKGYGFTDDRPNKLNAPQANLMAILLNGVFDQNLPWLFIGIGVAAGLVVEFLGIGCLPFAVGLYLPLELSTPVMIGGLIRLVVDLVHREPDPDSHDAGVLAASGFVAGEGLLGVAFGGVTAFCAWMWPHRDMTPHDLAPAVLEYVDLDVHYTFTDFWYRLLPLAPYALIVLWLFFVALRRAVPEPPPPPPEPYPQPDVSYKHRLPAFNPGSESKPAPIQMPPQSHPGDMPRYPGAH
ncbi:MAG: oligopeptide transporter, OPT family [Phycisphaerae bacterium]|nr:oligopeptide transporter, OPT family [Phycisphaerales bacterium]